MLPESQAEFPLTNSEYESLWPLLAAAGAESCNRHNMCFSYKNIEQKLLSRGTKVIPFLFTSLNQTEKNICGHCHAMQVLLMKQKDSFQVWVFIRQWH